MSCTTFSLGFWKMHHTHMESRKKKKQAVNTEYSFINLGTYLIAPKQSYGKRYFMNSVGPPSLYIFFPPIYYYFTPKLLVDLTTRLWNQANQQAKVLSYIPEIKDWTNSNKKYVCPNIQWPTHLRCLTLRWHQLLGQQPSLWFLS